MTIPNSIQDFRSGIAGEIAYAGPTRVMTALLDTAGPAENVFGYAYTLKGDGVVEAGGAGVFAGVMIHPKAYAIDTATAANGTSGEFLHMGEVFVDVDGVPVVGGKVYYVPASGQLTTVNTNTEIKGAVITRNVTDQGLCVVAFTGPQA